MHVFSTYNKILGIISQIILTLNHILIFDSDKIVSFSTVSEKKKSICSSLFHSDELQSNF